MYDYTINKHGVIFRENIRRPWKVEYRSCASQWEPYNGSSILSHESISDTAAKYFINRIER